MATDPELAIHLASGTDISAQWVGDTVAVLTESNSGFCRGTDQWKIHYAVKFSIAPVRSVGMNFEFAPPAERILVVKIGVSYVSTQNALENLQAENPGWDFNKVATSTVTQWNHALNRILVTGGTVKQKQLFYTSLYRTMLAPNTASDVNGTYVDMRDRVIKEPSFRMYYNWSGWDIYRYQIPLISMLFPDEVSAMISAYAASGMPRWGLANLGLGVMVGDPGQMIVGEAWAMGARKYNAQKVFDALRALQGWAKASGSRYQPIPGEPAETEAVHFL